MEFSISFFSFLVIFFFFVDALPYEKNGLLMYNKNTLESENGFELYEITKSSQFEYKNYTNGYPKRGATIKGIVGTVDENGKDMIIVYGKISFLDQMRTQQMIFVADGKYHPLNADIVSEAFDSVTMISRESMIITGIINYFEGQKAYNCLLCNINSECSLLSSTTHVGIPDYQNTLSNSFDGENSVFYTLLRVSQGLCYVSLTKWDNKNCNSPYF